MKQLYLFLAAMLLLCLAPMPYGYFMLVRYAMMIAGGVMAYLYYQRKKLTAVWVFVSLAVLFQPIYKIALGRTLWNVVDVIVAVLMVGLYLLERRQEQKVYITQNTKGSDEQKALEDENRIEFRMGGRLAPNELLYVASEEDKQLTELFENHPEMLEGWGQMIGFHVVYLPLLMKRLADKKVLQYRAPYMSDAELKGIRIGNDFLLQYLDNPSDRIKIKHGLIRTENIHRDADGEDKATNRYYPLSSVSGEPLIDQLHRIGKQISSEESRNARLIEGKVQEDIHSDDDIEELLEEVKERIRQLKQRGIAEYILEQLIHPDDRLSRMVITKDYRILLPDYQDMEIKMEPIVKAVYLLFLKHPEGIVFKHLPDYRRELAEIYTKLRPLGLSERALQSIEDVTNPLLNSINEKCARIRGAFLGEFDDYMAKSYYIDGPRGEAKKIALPRDLVVWE